MHRLEKCVGMWPTVLNSPVLSHTPYIAFRHLPPKKDVINQYLEFGTTPRKSKLTAFQ